MLVIKKTKQKYLLFLFGVFHSNFW